MFALAGPACRSSTSMSSQQSLIGIFHGQRIHGQGCHLLIIGVNLGSKQSKYVINVFRQPTILKFWTIRIRCEKKMYGRNYCSQCTTWRGGFLGLGLTYGFSSTTRGSWPPSLELLHRYRKAPNNFLALTPSIAAMSARVNGGLPSSFCATTNPNRGRSPQRSTHLGPACMVFFCCSPQIILEQVDWDSNTNKSHTYPYVLVDLRIQMWCWETISLSWWLFATLCLHRVFHYTIVKKQ